MIYKLCYADGHWLYFTLRGVQEQWGDDWDDVPFEHNAGDPYDDPEMPQVVCVGYHSEHFKLPCNGQINSSYSVRDINAGKVPWLRSDYGCLFAGASLSEAVLFFRKSRSPLFLPIGFREEEISWPI